MDIRTIRYFMVVAEELNITKAAQKLNMAQPPLTRQIKQLEEELGVKLLVRDKKRIALTEEGKLLYQRGEQIVSLISKTGQEVKNLKKGLSGTLYIGTVEGIGPHILSKWIATFQKRYPKVYYKIWNGSTDDVIDRLDKGLLDVALIMEPLDHEKLDSILVDTVPWVAMINNDHPLAKKIGDTIELKELEDIPIILPSRKYRIDEITGWFDKADTRLNMVCEMSSYLNARELVMQNIGVAIFPSTTKIPHLNNMIVQKRIVNPDRIAQYALVWVNKRKLSVIGEHFVDNVRELLMDNLDNS